MGLVVAGGRASREEEEERERERRGQEETLEVERECAAGEEGCLG